MSGQDIDFRHDPADPCILPFLVQRQYAYLGLTNNYSSEPGKEGF